MFSRDCFGGGKSYYKKEQSFNLTEVTLCFSSFATLKQSIYFVSVVNQSHLIQ